MENGRFIRTGHREVSASGAGDVPKAKEREVQSEDSQDPLKHYGSKTKHLRQMAYWTKDKFWGQESSFGKMATPARAPELRPPRSLRPPWALLGNPACGASLSPCTMCSLP
ncbi:uncharacterized protein LOC134483116 [Rattus norvegicus]|uniref:uncharacterized protein LOC134483116 n=1 Tax=Rattus norvegicus TaxID=10116 RepID=UPI00005087D1